MDKFSSLDVQHFDAQNSVKRKKKNVQFTTMQHSKSI